MGKFKTIFMTCFSLGLAAGAGYYLYKRFVRKEGEEEEGKSNSSTQAGTENVHVYDKIEDLDESPKGQESSEVPAHVADGRTEDLNKDPKSHDDKAVQTDATDDKSLAMNKDPNGRENKEAAASIASTSTDDDSQGAAKAVKKESSLQPKGKDDKEGKTKPTKKKRKKKFNFGGFKKGFLL